MANVAQNNLSAREVKRRRTNVSKQIRQLRTSHAEILLGLRNLSIALQRRPSLFDAFLQLRKALSAPPDRETPQYFGAKPVVIRHSPSTQRKSLSSSPVSPIGPKRVGKGSTAKRGQIDS